MNRDNESLLLFDILLLFQVEFAQSASTVLVVISVQSHREMIDTVTTYM